MGNSRPKLVLDTNVPGKLVSLYRDQQESIVRRSNRQFRLIASPQTHLELINEIISGAETHFGVDQDKFRLMVGTGQIQFLPFRFTFALLSALGMEVSLPLLAGGSGPTTP